MLRFIFRRLLATVPIVVEVATITLTWFCRISLIIPGRRSGRSSEYSQSISMFLPST